MTASPDGPAGPDSVLSSLEFIEKKGVPGAAECRRNNLSLKEASKVLWKLYPQGRNPIVDKWIRDVHQFGLKRVGDMELFLKTLGDGKGDAKLSERAKAVYLATPRGAVIADLKRPHHWYFYILFVLSVMLSWASLGLYVFKAVAPATVPDPMTMIIITVLRELAPPVVWMILKKVVVSTFFAALYSGRHLAIAAASTSKKSKAAQALPYVELSVAIVAIVACGVLSLYMRTPFLFVAGSVLAVYLLRKKPKTGAMI
jgi:hypothetical protein